ncbi:M48 family metallopeptidase [uncultured Megasphaera sp.]|uniref:M48 family metallopeptidase n=2 Tax=uncultured Megasphaera sp. TaxID=165188 RepID=UPI0025DD5E1E|nr:M48 family metallopeptidase [uncultured Megasphaera sp.]
MKKWKKWLTTIVTSLSLCVVPAAMVSAASTVETLLYGAAAMALAKQQLMQMDNTQQQKMLANTKSQTGVVDNEAYSDRLENIQRNLVATGLIQRNYDVYANPSKDLNAFETIGGVISVNKGMLDALNDDELAFTLCHEMQHGEKRHAVNGVLKSIGISTLVDVSLGGNADVLDILLGSVAVNYIDNEFVTMDQEKQADALGFNVLKNSGYNVGGAAASMEYVYEKYGELWQEGFKRIISPNNHPQMSSRIEKLAGRMSLWSGNHVQVGGSTVYVNAQPVVTPAAAGDYSSRRRAFLVAGNLARATHDVYGEAPKENQVVTQTLNKKTPSWNVAAKGNDVYVNDLRIMTCASGDDSPAIVKNIQQALEAKPAMLSKKEIQKQNKAWTQKYGYKDKKEKNEKK